MESAQYIGRKVIKRVVKSLLTAGSAKPGHMETTALFRASFFCMEPTAPGSHPHRHLHAGHQ